jgi:hypothetical protein
MAVQGAEEPEVQTTPMEHLGLTTRAEAAVLETAMVLVALEMEKQAALVLSSSKSQIRIAQSFHRVWTSVTTLQTLTTQNPLHQ